MIRWADYPGKKFLTDEERKELAVLMIKSDVLNEKLRTEALRQGKERRIVGGVLLSGGSEHLYCGLGYAMLKNGPCEGWFDHRSHINYVMRGVKEFLMFSQMIAKQTSPSLGRDGYMDAPFYDLGIHEFSSDMAASVPVAGGYAFAKEYLRTHIEKSTDPRTVFVVVLGDGAMNQGIVAEAVNEMVLHNLPVLIVCNNNSVGYSVAAHKETVTSYTKRMEEGFGLHVMEPLNGNNVQDVYYASSIAIQKIREGAGTHFMDVKSVREDTHNVNDSVTSIPKEELRESKAENKIKFYLQYLKDLDTWDDPKIIDDEFIERTYSEYRAYLNEEFERAASAPDFPETREALGRVFVEVVQPPELPRPEPGERMLKYREAINEAHVHALESNPRTVVFGEDVAVKGGALGITKGLMRRFGGHRVWDTTLAENWIVGSAAGFASAGVPVVTEGEYGNFILCGFGQLANKVGPFCYMNQRGLQIIVRLPQGGRINSNHYHSACTEGLFAHLPGFKIVCPANAYDAKGLFMSAFNDPNPVIYCDWVAAYDWSMPVPKGSYQIPLGKADIKRAGSDLTIITYGALMVKGALDASLELEQAGISTEVVDLRSFWGEEDMPFDVETCWKSIKKTNRALVLHEAQIGFGIGAEVVTGLVVDAGFRGDIDRLAAVHTPVPFAPKLENFRLPSVAEIVESGAKLVWGESREPGMWKKYFPSAQERYRRMKGEK